MSKNSIFLLCYASAGLIVYVISCNSSTAASDKLTFYYYPQKNVYFDPSAHKYFYSLDGAKTWDSMGANTENPAALGPRIILSSTVKQIWKFNPTHRKEYNGSLINIPPGDTMLVEGDKPVFKKPAVVPKKVVKKEKRNFFQRLFGKKKKDNDY